MSHFPGCWCDACLAREGRATLDTAPALETCYDGVTGDARCGCLACARLKMTPASWNAGTAENNRIAYDIGSDAIILETTGASVRPTMGA